MTDVLTDIKDMIKEEEIQTENPTPKIDMIYNFLILKSIAKQSKKEISEYTEKRKDVRNGKTLVMGTRITTKELLLIMAEGKSKPNMCEYIYKQYPSIDSEEKIIYGALYEVSRVNTLIFIIKVLLKNETTFR